MKKRILSILLMCCMVLTLLPVQALAEDSAYTVGEDTGVSARALAGTAGTKLKADNIDDYVAKGLGGGVYTLAEDVTISGTLRVTGEATVDLNGHILRYAEEAEPDSIFRVTSGSTLTLTDSRPEAEHGGETLPAGGLITGGEGYRRDYGAGQSYSYYGGGVYVEAGASFACWRAAPSMPAASRAERIKRSAAASMPRAAPSPCPAAPSGTALSQPITVPAAARSMPRPAPSPCPAASSAAALPCPAAAS